MTKKKDDSSKAKKVALLVGSLSKTSLSQSLAKYLIATAPKTLTFEIIDIGNLPLYNEDLDESPPASWTQFRKKLKNFEGFLFVTPEINNSMPAALKNAIDIASRPFGQNIFESKPGAIVSIYSDAANLAGAGPHLRQSLIFLKVQTMQQPEANIEENKELFDSNGNLTNPTTLKYMQSFMQSFNDWAYQ